MPQSVQTRAVQGAHHEATLVRGLSLMDSVMLMVGFDKGTPEEQIVMRWLRERYHAPSDDVNQPVDKPAAGAWTCFRSFEQFLAPARVPA